MRAIIVGERPSCADHDEAFCVDSRSGRLLAALAGVERIGSVAATVNLYPSADGRWSVPRAREWADYLLRQHHYDRWLLCGRRVAEAFGLDAEPLVWTQHRGALMALFPHPSGRNLYWNDPARGRAAGEFLKAAVSDHLWTPA